MNHRRIALAAALAAALASPATASADTRRVELAADLPVIESSFQSWDICQQVDTWIEALGALSTVLPRLCHNEMTHSFGVGPAAITLAGTLEQLVVKDGYVHVEGPVNVAIEMTPLRVSGGRAPTFSPCDRGDFPGCQALPAAGDALEYFLSLVPALEVELPAAPRVCVPGTPIVTRAGYYKRGRWIPGRWDGRRWIAPRYVRGAWVAPVVETCTITDFGALPAVAAPEIESVAIDAYPHLVADMGLTVAGDGSIEIEIPIPYAGATVGYANSLVDLKLAAGVSLVVSLEVNDAGADAYLSFDQKMHVRSLYRRGEGWSQSAEILDSEMAPDLVPHSAEVTVRAGVKLGLEATAKASIGSSEGDDSDSEPVSVAEAAAADEGPSAEVAEEDGGDDIELPPLPVEERVQCAAEWLVNGPSLELGVEAKAELVVFVEGRYPLFGDAEAAFDIDAGSEFSHAEALSAPGMCEIGCETVAGEGSEACGTIELLRVDVASI